MNKETSLNPQMEELVILDYSTCEIHLYKVKADEDVDESYIENLGHKSSCCSWMFGEFIDIIRHKYEAD